MTMLPASKDSLISSFSVCISFISLCLSFTLAITSNMILKKSGERGCLVPDYTKRFNMPLNITSFTWFKTFSDKSTVKNVILKRKMTIIIMNFAGRYDCRLVRFGGLYSSKQVCLFPSNGRIVTHAPSCTSKKSHKEE